MLATPNPWQPLLAGLLSSQWSDCSSFISNKENECIFIVQPAVSIASVSTINQKGIYRFSRDAFQGKTSKIKKRNRDTLILSLNLHVYARQVYCEFLQLVLPNQDFDFPRILMLIPFSLLKVDFQHLKFNTAEIQHSLLSTHRLHYQCQKLQRRQLKTF